MYGTYGMTFKGPFLEHLKKSKRVLEFWLYLGVRTCLLFLGSIVLTLSHFLCFFFWFYITREFDRLLNRGNARILTTNFVSLGDIFTL